MTYATIYSIRLGERPLFSGEKLPGEEAYRNLTTGQRVLAKNSLASLFGDEDLHAIMTARHLTLSIYNGRIRDLDIRFEHAEGIGESVFVVDEVRRVTDFYDVKLSDLFAEPDYDAMCKDVF